jgi:hypothetical protein
MGLTPIGLYIPPCWRFPYGMRVFADSAQRRSKRQSLANEL